MVIGRRGLIVGATAFLGAPAIIRTPGLLMPIRPLPFQTLLLQYDFHTREYTAVDVMPPFNIVNLHSEMLWMSPEGPTFRGIPVKLRK